MSGDVTDSTVVITREKMQAVLRAVHNELPDHLGFFIVVVPFGNGVSDPAARALAQYGSNINRDDAVASLKALLFRWGVEEKWMEAAK